MSNCRYSYNVQYYLKHTENFVGTNSYFNFEEQIWKFIILSQRTYKSFKSKMENLIAIHLCSEVQKWYPSWVLKQHSGYVTVILSSANSHWNFCLSGFYYNKVVEILYMSKVTYYHIEMEPTTGFPSQLKFPLEHYHLLSMYT